MQRKPRPRGVDLRAWLLQNREIDAITGCWNWTRLKDNHGYGRFHLKGKLEFVHRLAFKLFSKDEESGYVLHHCDNRACFNPSHLYLGTLAQNARDRNERGRTCIGMKHPAHKLTPEIVRIVRGSLLSREQLAKQFGVGHTIIGRVKARTSYRDVPEECSVS